MFGAIAPPGHPLPSAARAEMERAFGEDFSDVRVHADAAAHDSADLLAAAAYTSGEQIVLGRGVGLAGMRGRRLLAHELSHVVQQRRGPVDGTAAPGGIRVSEPGDRFELQAERAATQFASGVRVSLGSLRSSCADNGLLPVQTFPLGRRLAKRAFWRALFRRGAPVAPGLEPETVPWPEFDQNPAFAGIHGRLAGHIALYSGFIAAEPNADNVLRTDPIGADLDAQRAVRADVEALLTGVRARVIGGVQEALRGGFHEQSIAGDYDSAADWNEIVQAAATEIVEQVAPIMFPPGADYVVGDLETLLQAVCLAAGSRAYQVGTNVGAERAVIVDVIFLRALVPLLSDPTTRGPAGTLRAEAMKAAGKVLVAVSSGTGQTVVLPWMQQLVARHLPDRDAFIDSVLQQVGAPAHAQLGAAPAQGAPAVAQPAPLGAPPNIPLPLPPLPNRLRRRDGRFMTV